MAFRSISTSTTRTVSPPSGIADGDILIAYGRSYFGSFAAVTLPTGFTQIAARVTGGGWSRIATVIGWKRAASESGNYVFTATYQDNFRGAVAAYSGRLSAGDPVAAFSDTAYITSNTVLRAAGITPGTSGVDLIFVGGSGTKTISTVPSGMNDRYSGDLAGLADLLNQTGDATGDKDGTLNEATTVKHAFLVALKPAAAATPNIAAILHHLRQQGIC